MDSVGHLTYWTLATIHVLLYRETQVAVQLAVVARVV